MNKPKVFVVHDPELTTGNEPLPKNVNSTRLKADFHALIQAAAGKSDSGKAWESIMPGIEPASKVTIKANCLKPETAAQFATLESTVEGLTSMCNGSFPAGNINIIDNNLGGQFNPDHVNFVFGRDNLDRLGVWHEKDSYHGPTIDVVGNPLHISTRLAEAGPYCLSLVATRIHAGGAGHLSGNIKNFMGAASTLKDDFRALAAYTGGQFHDRENHQGFVDLFRNYMREHIRLYIADMVLIPDKECGQYDSIGNRIAVSTDPCAIDSWSVDVLKEFYEKPTKRVPLTLEAGGVGSTDYDLISISLP